MDSGLQVFIADDHPIFRRGLCEVIESASNLRLAGQAPNGEEAFRLADALQPDITILDVKMPGMTGLQVARKLLQKDPRVKIVLLTMHEDEDLLNEALALGIHAYVLKDNAVEDLLAAIDAVSNGRRFVSASLSDLLLSRRSRTEALHRQRPGLDRLTPSERRILRLVADDKTSKEIADLIGCAVRTVETHRQNISGKLELNGSHSLLKFAYDNRSLF